MPDPEIVEYVSPTEGLETYPVMRQLRPHLDRAAYEAGLRDLAADGARLIAAKRAEAVLGCAVFRFQHRLALGRLVYVDDLVTDETRRSQGIGAALLAWIDREAAARGATTVVLDSGVQRSAAHRFYFANGYAITSFTFKKTVKE